MSDALDKAARALDAAGKALTLAERIAASLGGGDPKKRATWHRLRAIRRDKRASTARLARVRLNAAAGAAADRAIADVLDPPAATCPAG